MPPTQPSQLDFLTRWERSGAAERANYQLFLSELCDYLDLPRPDPTQPDDSLNDYTFEKPVQFRDLFAQSTGRIDLYKKGCFVLEAKQGSQQPTQNARAHRRGTAIRGTAHWDEAMLAARGQAEQYAKALPVSHGWPPFLVVVDVGHSIELYADFSLTGKAYLPFPDPRSFRILLPELPQEENRNRLRAVWIDPLSLDPSRHTAKVTREVAAKLAGLATTLENQFPPKEVAEFLTRCIFTSFAEDVGLLPQRGWLNLLESLRANVENFPPMAEALWQTMNDGGFSPILRAQLLKFNGGLFESTRALPLTRDQLNLLIEAADSKWRDVEPAIFGTLLERALDPDERHALGAHYTPRAYVERLVVPTLVEPLREDWRNAQAVITEQVAKGQQSEAIATARAFHQKLCQTRVLDPACGSGNFLYVALEHMKRLEGEVLEALHSLGESQQVLEHSGLTVDPHQLLGLEINPRAAVIADLVLWIGYLQWHFRTRGNANPPLPVIKNFHNIQHQDALLTWKSKIPALDNDGNPITQWDGRTTKEHPTTGKQVPDESARIVVWSYLDVERRTWPECDFVVGNPPFLGKGKIREELGDGYVEALRNTYRGEIPDGADYVMYWWAKASELLHNHKINRFGLITTNSISQTMSRRVVAHALASQPKCSLVFAIPDHPWVDSKTAANVRIAMTVLAHGEREGLLLSCTVERKLPDGDKDVQFIERMGVIHENLTVGPNVTDTRPLASNQEICGTGLILGSRGFVVTEEEAGQLQSDSAHEESRLIFPFYNGRDLTDQPRGIFVIDTIGWTDTSLRSKHPAIYQHLRDSVYLDRRNNRDQRLREQWWLPRRSNEQVRASLVGLNRYIATPETASHRFFVFLPTEIRPEHRLIVTGSSDAYHLGVLSSRPHVEWALATGGTLEDRPVYNKTLAFDTYPFPVCTEQQKLDIRTVAEELDAHRKRQQQLHPTLTLTDMYNVLEKLRASESLTTQDLSIYEMGLIGILREIHDDLDKAVFAAYGWPVDLTTEQILANIVALNAERRAEEANGLVRWLRPEYQAPNAPAMQQALGGLIPVEAPAAARRKQPWPGTLTDQVRAIKDVLRAAPMQTPQQIAAAFKPASRTRVQEILDTLTALGQTREVNGSYLL